MNAQQIILTIDVEDWFQVENFKGYIARERWDTLGKRYEKSTCSLLELLERHNIKATFFVLGWNAQQTPGLVRDIVASGHELASHGFNHTLNTELTLSELRDDLQRSKAILEDISGVEVLGYRAPSFSITAETMDLLKDLGYRYDASLNLSSLNDRHGTLDLTQYRKVDAAYVDADNFIELPVGNLPLGKRYAPWGGGGYFRLIPSPLFHTGVRRILNREGAFIFYTHPWEFDPDQPRVTEASVSNRFRHYTGLNRSTQKLDTFIQAFQTTQFVRCVDYFDAITQKLMDAA